MRGLDCFVKASVSQFSAVFLIITLFAFAVGFCCWGVLDVEYGLKFGYPAASCLHSASGFWSYSWFNLGPVGGREIYEELWQASDF